MHHSVYLGSIHCILKSINIDAVPQSISAWILGNFHNKIVILLVINILLIVGMVMDTTPAILILTPILLPIVQQSV